MTTLYPGAIDSKVSPVSTDLTNGPTDSTYGSGHAAEHKFANDAITAVETKLGVTGSTDHNSVDYKLQTITGAQQAASTAYVDNKVLGLLNDRGNYDASGNVFPSTGGSGAAGAIMKGDVWFISVAGTLGGVAVTVGDTVRALVNTPGQTAGNWDILMVEGTSVTSVTGLNTDNTNPRAPVVRVSVDPATIGGDGTPGAPLTAVGGGGTGGENTLLLLYPAEAMSPGDTFAVTKPAFSAATSIMKFGTITDNEKGAFMVVGNGISMSSIKMALKKI